MKKTLRKINHNNHTLQWISNKTVGFIGDETDYIHLAGNVKLVYVSLENCLSVIDKIDYLLVMTPKVGLESEYINGKYKLVKTIVEKIKSVNDKLKMVLIYNGAVNRAGYYLLVKYFDLIINEEFITRKKLNVKADSIFDYPYINVINPSISNPIDTFNENNEMLFSDVNQNVDEYLSQIGRQVINEVLSTDIPLKFVNTQLDTLNLDNEGLEIENLEAKDINYLEQLNLMKKFRYNFSFQPYFINSVSIEPSSIDAAAMGKIVVTNHRVGASNYLYTSNNINIPGDTTRVLTQSNDQLLEQRLEGIRIVYSNHLAEHLLQTIESKLFSQQLDKQFQLYVISDDVSCFENQTIQDFKVVSDSSQIIQENVVTLVTEYSRDHRYKMTYLEDLINAFKYTNATRVQVGSEIEFNFVDVKGDDCLGMWVKDKPTDIIFNIQKNVILEEKTIKLGTPELTFIVPVFNTGVLLKYRAISSLQRTDFFNQIKILLVDDGSTDKITREICRELATEYANIDVFMFEDGGSGSASRPRNKGIELTKTKYIAFIDPDDEFDGEAYEFMLGKMKSNDIDLIQGGTYIYGLEVKQSPNQHYNEFSICKGIDKLQKNEFFANSIQSAIYQLQFLKDNNLQMELGLAGEDTLFHYQVLFSSNKIGYTNKCNFKYYTGRVGSVTTVRDLTLLEKRYQVAKKIHETMVENNALDLYAKLRLETYIFYSIINIVFNLQPEFKVDGLKICHKYIDIFGVEYFGEHVQAIYYTNDFEQFKKIVLAYRENIPVQEIDELPPSDEQKPTFISKLFRKLKK